MACLATIWGISNFELEALNYLEHYGLIRVKDQPIDYRHNWDNSTCFTAWFFIEIGRQADHHDRGETHFWELENVGCPNTGWMGILCSILHRISTTNMALVHA